MRWIDGGGDSLIKWDKGSWENSQDYWQWCFLQPLVEAFCNFLTHKHSLWEEDLKDEEHGTHRGHNSHDQITNAPS
ncbi:hypothetical protein CR513_25069, partial [Mucuna pruriens]